MSEKPLSVQKGRKGDLKAICLSNRETATNFTKLGKSFLHIKMLLNCVFHFLSLNNSRVSMSIHPYACLFISDPSLKKKQSSSIIEENLWSIVCKKEYFQIYEMKSFKG